MIKREETDKNDEQDIVIEVMEDEERAQEESKVDYKKIHNTENLDDDSV